MNIEGPSWAAVSNIEETVGLVASDKSSHLGSLCFDYQGLFDWTLLCVRGCGTEHRASWDDNIVQHPRGHGRPGRQRLLTDHLQHLLIRKNVGLV